MGGGALPSSNISVVHAKKMHTHTGQKWDIQYAVQYPNVFTGHIARRWRFCSSRTYVLCLLAFYTLEAKVHLHIREGGGSYIF
jgi:hypothetical protein